MQEKPHKCKECGMGFKEICRLKIHIQGVHQGVKFSCDICGKDFLDPKNHKRHMRKVHKNVEVIETE